MDTLLISLFSKLIEFTSLIDTKRGCSYLSWVIQKTSYLLKEKNPSVIANNLITTTIPHTPISVYQYQHAPSNIKSIIQNNYKLIGNAYYFNSTNLTEQEALLIAKHIFFQRGNVVWIEFGYNIGNEFGGKHPAIILKNFDSELFVIPISSKKPTLNISASSNEIIEVPKIYGFKNISRWVNITRMRKVSIQRVDFSGSIGSIPGTLIDKIVNHIKQEF